MSDEERAETQTLFLAAYERTANIITAADEVGIDRTLPYYWQEHDEQFSIAYGLADKAANALIEAEIRSRAIDGWLEPLVSAGQHVADVRKKSDTLLIFLAKRRMPEYRDKQQDININNVNVQVERNELYARMHDDELDRLESLWNAVQERRQLGNDNTR